MQGRGASAYDVLIDWMHVNRGRELAGEILSFCRGVAG